MTIEHVQPSEHAQVGAMLARCEEYSVVPYSGKSEKGWLARLRVCGTHSNRVCIEKGKTQLEAIRSAVEAAGLGSNCADDEQPR